MTIYTRKDEQKDMVLLILVKTLVGNLSGQEWGGGGRSYKS